MPPKRLFHVPFMTTFMYEDIAEDVEEKGYVAISHVWGEQQMYSAGQFGINGGVDWEVPLSNPNKISRLVNAMNHYGKEYCWIDVLCMPQDKQSEINLEIPFMGEYYAGADITLVLSDINYVISGDYAVWYDMMSDIAISQRDATFEENSWMNSKRYLINFDKDKWFKRVWTLQEAVLSKKVICVDAGGQHVNISNIIKRLRETQPMDVQYAGNMFGGEGSSSLVAIGNMKEELENGRMNIARILVVNNGRDCYKIHDRFYGVFGILGYKNFVVDYDMDVDSLNKLVIQYAYSKGDVSWISVDGGVDTNFIQPMYKDFIHVGVYWKEKTPGSCNITFGDDLHLEAMEFATVVATDRFVGKNRIIHNVLPWLVHSFKSWGFGSIDILFPIMGHIAIPDEVVRVGVMFIDLIAEGMSLGNTAHIMGDTLGDECRHLTHVISKFLLNVVTCKTITIVKANTKNHGQSYALIVSGNVDIGDKIVVPKILDPVGRSVGVITSNFRRKGVCLTPRMMVWGEQEATYFKSHKFLM